MIINYHLALERWLKDLENRNPKEIDLTLDRILQIATKLGLRALEPTVITVAGTNGKGSTVAVLESIYCEAGFKVGTYTSPHLLRFNERVKINKKLCSDKNLVEAIQWIDANRGLIPLTYFEIITLAALWIFKQQSLDLIILEVGLGGRLDATNCVDSDLAIITTIDFDHQDYLGSSLEAIGYEKAGIMRFQKPCIYADYHPPQTILAKAEDCQATFLCRGIDYDYQSDEKGLTLYYQKRSLSLPASSYHYNSVVAAVIATFCLEDKLRVDDIAITTGIQKAFVPGRQQVFVDATARSIVFDVAHNPQSARYLASFLEQRFPGKIIHAVFSALADKDIKSMILPLKTLVSHWYVAPLDTKRRASLDQLIQSFKAHEISIDLCYNTPILAYESACDLAKSGEVIVIFGSFFTVAQILERRDYETANG